MWFCTDGYLLGHGSYEVKWSIIAANSIQSDSIAARPGQSKFTDHNTSYNNNQTNKD